ARDNTAGGPLGRTTPRRRFPVWLRSVHRQGCLHHVDVSQLGMRPLKNRLVERIGLAIVFISSTVLRVENNL
ncbi:MAG TPA: hypothetical protein PKA51_03770, partial [Kiritimatiellia bacterium]|nr:hypothetical protein [Kiritimatiellia bacterium]